MHSGKSRIAIACTTYNHEKYIARAIESFLMQQVSEPFEIHICDDASTDNTQAIITAYQKNIRISSKRIYSGKIFGKRDTQFQNTFCFQQFQQNMSPYAKGMIISQTP